MSYFAALIIALLLLPQFNPILAQQESLVVSPELYSTAQKKLAVEEIIKGKDVSQLSPEELQEVIATAFKAGYLAPIGTLTEKGSEYILATGLSGVAIGAIPVGEYVISVNQIPEILIETPTTFLVKLPTNNILEIGMRQGKKSTNLQIYKSTNNLIQKIMQFITRKPTFSTSSILSTSARVPVTIKLYQDVNANSQFDPGEKPVPWANVKVTLRKISKEQDLSLQQGMNSIQFEKLSSNFKTAYEVVSQAVAAGAAQATFINLTNNVPQSVTLKNLEFFGEDFPIEPKMNYLVYLSQATKLTKIERN